MSASTESTLKSRFGKSVKKERLDQLIAHYARNPENEAIVKVGSQLSDDKLFFSFLSGVPSFRVVYDGVLGARDLDDIVAVSQKLALANPNVAFSFLRSGSKVVDAVPTYSKKQVVGMANTLRDVNALLAFFENCGRVANDAGTAAVFMKWFGDAVSLAGSEQAEHFGYDLVSQAVLNYFKQDGAIFPLSPVVRPYSNYGVGVVGAMEAFERDSDRKGELSEFVDYLKSPAGKLLLLNFYDGALKQVLQDCVPVSTVLRKGFVQQKTTSLLERIGITQEQLTVLQNDAGQVPEICTSFQEEYDLLVNYLTNFKLKEKEVAEVEQETNKITHNYGRLIDVINGKRQTVVQIKKELFEKNDKIDLCDILNRVYTAVDELVGDDLKKELEYFKDNAKDIEYVKDVISRINSDLEERANALKQKKTVYEKESSEKLELLKIEQVFYQRLTDKQLQLLPTDKCPRIIEKNKQVWLFLPEGTTINGEYESQNIGRHTYVTRKEWGAEK